MTVNATWHPPVFPASAPDALLRSAPADGLLPDGFFTTTHHPTYVKLNGRWMLARRTRMDAHLVVDGDTVVMLEMRHVRAGMAVVCAATEDGTQGVFTHGNAFSAEAGGAEAFAFMRGGPSRERPVSYPALARALREHARDGYITWVPGPAVVHAAARAPFRWLVEHGFVHAVLAGNALAVHDVEMETEGSALGVDAEGRPLAQGHARHVRAIQRVRAAGGISAMVKSGQLSGGIMHALVTRGVPYVLAGSIRDDGPLPETLTDTAAAQDAMRVHAERSTLVVVLATALHGIALGNMLPTFRERGAGTLVPVPLWCVDQDEFVLRKLADRGSAQALGMAANARDFLGMLVAALKEDAAA